MRFVLKVVGVEPKLAGYTPVQKSDYTPNAKLYTQILFWMYGKNVPEFPEGVTRLPSYYRLPRETVYIYCIGGKPIGGVRLHDNDDSSTDIDIYVEPEYRRKSIATQLLNYMVEDGVNLDEIINHPAATRTDEGDALAKDFFKS